MAIRIALGADADFGIPQPPPGDARPRALLRQGVDSLSAASKSRRFWIARVST
ncbi:MAG: hypothetical protein MZV70_61140 [Desulfobacterales bacterium]|nr:hypothetical protein [Desulfobacterales bacterium]